METMDALGPWLDAVASGAPTPGGGAVGAATGAHAIALLEMVCNLTRGLSDHVGALSAHRAAFLDLAREDARAFGEVSGGYAMPRSTPEERAARTAAIQGALVGALQVPVDTIAQVAASLDDAARVAREANPNVASDAGIALVLLEATLDAAFYNVRINVRFLKDRDRGLDALERADDAIDAARARLVAMRSALDPHLTPRY
jgi:formiminotetrahydrofolate cyclodeaminase